MQCTSVTYLLPGQGNGFIMCAQSFENIDAIENRGSTKCYNFNVLENWQREADTKDDRSTACESFYFIYGKDYYNVSYKDSWVLLKWPRRACSEKKKCFSRTKWIWRVSLLVATMTSETLRSINARVWLLLFSRVKQTTVSSQSVTALEAFEADYNQENEFEEENVDSCLKIVSQGQGFGPITVPSLCLSHYRFFCEIVMWTCIIIAIRQ